MKSERSKGVNEHAQDEKRRSAVRSAFLYAFDHRLSDCGFFIEDPCTETGACKRRFYVSDLAG